MAATKIVADLRFPAHNTQTRMASENGIQRTRLSRGLVALLALLATAVFINYIDRGNLSIAAPLLKDELGVNPARLGFLLSAFSWTYATLQPVYGWLVDRLNVYWLFAACFSLWSLATAATGLVHVFALLVVLRFLLGISEAVIFPANSKIITLNYPEEHRGVANAVVIAGISLGPGLGMLLGGTLMARFGWRPFFVALGLVSLLWVPAWMRWMPKTKPVTSGSAVAAPSLLEFLRLRSAWGTCCGLWCGNYVNYFLLTWMPYYLVRELHFSMQTMAKIGGSGYLLGAGCAAVSGWLADRWIMAGASVTKARNVHGGGPGVRGYYVGAVRDGPSCGKRCFFVGCDGLLRCEHVEHLCHLTTACRARGGWTLGGLSKRIWKSRGCCGARSHWVAAAAYRTLCVGVFDCCRFRASLRRILGPGIGTCGACCMA